jgi:Amidase
VTFAWRVEPATTLCRKTSFMMAFPGSVDLSRVPDRLPYFVSPARSAGFQNSPARREPFRRSRGSCITSLGSILANPATTWGIPAFRDYMPWDDALMVARVDAAGVVILGKTRCAADVGRLAELQLHYGTTQQSLGPRRLVGRIVCGDLCSTKTGIWSE